MEMTPLSGDPESQGIDSKGDSDLEPGDCITPNKNSNVRREYGRREENTDLYRSLM